MRLSRRAFLFCALLGHASAPAQNIPAPKRELIRQAMAAMKVDQRIQALVDQRIGQDVQRIRLENPAAPDSLLAEARGVIAAAYAARMEGPDGLLPRIHAVFDRRLTEEDLRFAVDFRESDQGKRYRELVPRVVQESVEAGREWGERLRPEIRRRLEEHFRGTGMRF